MKAIVLAGGEGTRLRPLTSTYPKPLIPIADKPCIDYILQSLITGGIKEIIIATSYLSDKLIKTIGDGMEYDASIVYSFEETPAGTAGAVKRVRNFCEETFVVAMGDVVADVDIGSLVDFHKDRKAVATIALTKVEDPSQYGATAINDRGKIVRFLEKPKKEEAFSNLVNAGIYVLEREAVEFIPENEMFDFSKNLFPKLLSKGMPLYGIPLSGMWLDIGRPMDVLKASLEVVNHNGKEIAIEGAKTKGRMMIHEGLSVDDGVTIEGPCYIGPDVRIGRGAVIKGSCFHKGVTVGAGSHISNSLFMNNTKIGSRCTVNDSIFSVSCDIGEGAVVETSVVGERQSVGPSKTLRGEVVQ